MAVTRTPLIAGNWKMNLDHQQAIAFVQKLDWALKDAGHEAGSVEVALFPPFTDLRSVQTLISADKIAFAHGAQDVSAHDSGPYTGEVSGAFLKKLDCAYVIIGHSERRQHHAIPEQQQRKEEHGDGHDEEVSDPLCVKRPRITPVIVSIIIDDERGIPRQGVVCLHETERVAALLKYVE